MNNMYIITKTEAILFDGDLRIQEHSQETYKLVLERQGCEKTIIYGPEQALRNVMREAVISRHEGEANLTIPAWWTVDGNLITDDE